MTKKEKKVHEKVILLGKFYNEFSREPKAKEEYNGVKIGFFLHNIRKKGTKISGEDRNYLEELGLRLNSKNKQEQVHEKVILLGEFYREFNRNPKRADDYNGIKIGVFFENIRQKNIKICENDRIYLENIGIVFTSLNRQERVHQKVILLGKFYEEFGRCPKMREEYKDFKIGNFLNNVRRSITNITKEDRAYLQNLGIRL